MKRFNIYRHGTGIGTETSDDGKFVLASDYDALANACKEFIKHTGLAVEGLVADAESRKWIAPEIWQELEWSRDASRNLALALIGEKGV